MTCSPLSKDAGLLGAAAVHSSVSGAFTQVSHITEGEHRGPEERNGSRWNLRMVERAQGTGHNTSRQTGNLVDTTYAVSLVHVSSPLLYSLLQPHLSEFQLYSSGLLS